MNTTKTKITLLLCILLVQCNFNIDKPSDLPLLLNYSKGTAPKDRYSVVCEADSPTVATKSLKGTVKDYQTGATIANTRVATDPATTSTTTDASGEFTISAIESTTSEVTVNLSASRYSLFSAKIKLTCQNSRIDSLLDPITIAAAGVNPCIAGTSKLNGCNIQ